MAQRSKALVALREDLGLSAPIWQLKTICNSSAQGSIALFGEPRALAQTYIQAKYIAFKK